jgi:hypothetical protein
MQIQKITITIVPAKEGYELNMEIEKTKNTDLRGVEVIKILNEAIATILNQIV